MRQTVDLAEGEKLYQEYCASCHGADLEGQVGWRSAGEDGILPAPPHDETGHTWRIMSDGSHRWWNGSDWQMG